MHLELEYMYEITEILYENKTHNTDLNLHFQKISYIVIFRSSFNFK